MSLLPRLIYCLVFCLRRRFFRGSIHVDSLGNHKRVLIIKLDAIGDFILWLDAAKELRRIYPRNEYLLTLLGNRQWIELAETLTYFDDVWAVDRPSFFAQTAQCFDLLERFRSVTFDVVLHPVYSREFLFGDLFVWASSAKQKIGMHGDCANLNWWQKRLGDRCYTDLVLGTNEHTGELEHNALLLRWLGLADFMAGVPALEGPYERYYMQLPADYYVIIAGAGVSLRVWPASNFIALIEQVYALTGMTAVVCGGQRELELGKTLEHGASVPIIDLTGQTSLPELIAVISEAHFMIGNETGGVHIATALGVPSVCILGGGHFGRFIPYSSDIVTQKQLPIPVFDQMECFGCNWECLYCVQPEKAAPCLENVSLESVISVVVALVENQNNSQRDSS